MAGALVVVLAVGLLVLVRVVGDDDPPVAPTTWARSVCTALTPWRSRVADLTVQANHQIGGTSTPADTKRSLSALLAGAEQASEQARQRVAAAGVPEVDGGADVAGRVVTALARARDAYGHAKAKIGQLDPARAGPFYDAVADAFTRLGQEHKASELDVRSLGPDPLRRAFDEVPECR